MHKILIISYFYPPANFVGGERTAAWAKYLHENGFYPIIITRQWNDGQTDLIDKVQNNSLEVEYNETHEVHRLPYKRSLRDRCSTYKWLKPLQKALTLYELIASNFFIRALPYSNFYGYSKKLLKVDPTITRVIASGRPFQTFFIGYQLKKDFPAIHWIPDYRDEWSTHTAFFINSKQIGFLKKIEINRELKWTSNASFFTTTSPSLVNKIGLNLRAKGFAIYNGFEKLKVPLDQNNTIAKDELRVIYSGTLYAYQKIELLIEAVKFINHQNNQVRVYVEYVGVNMNPQEEKRLMELIKTDNSFAIHPRMPKDSLMNFYARADVLYLTAYEGNNGWLPVKLFEYFSIEKPVLLCPSDHNLMEEFILNTESGYVADSLEECVQGLNQLMELKQNKQPLISSRNKKEGDFFTRQHQTKLLARILDTL